MSKSWTNSHIIGLDARRWCIHWWPLSNNLRNTGDYRMYERIGASSITKGSTNSNKVSKLYWVVMGQLTNPSLQQFATHSINSGGLTLRMKRLRERLAATNCKASYFSTSKTYHTYWGTWWVLWIWAFWN